MLHVSVLGEQAIVDDGTGRVRARSSRTVALVAFLVAHAGSPQSRQRIAGLFWPDSTEAQALTNLTWASGRPGRRTLRRLTR
jgi:DNA-binding SARP family transcriptional activator